MLGVQAIAVLLLCVYGALKPGRWRSDDGHKASNSELTRLMTTFAVVDSLLYEVQESTRALHHMSMTPTVQNRLCRAALAKPGLKDHVTSMYDDIAANGGLDSGCGDDGLAEFILHYAPNLEDELSEVDSTSGATMMQQIVWLMDTDGYVHVPSRVVCGPT